MNRLSSVNVTFAEIKQAEPRIWWPNGMGQPALYHAVVTFQDKDGNNA
ncbi:MAG: hypothetical protein MZV63_34930 [Marinilabiliales bacterium]|nr:hypothetical protein [Marinilabiliales bacterium]